MKATKNVAYFFFFLVIFTSCKTKKNSVNTPITIKKMSAKKVVRKHLSANFDKKTVDAKLKVYYKDSKNGLGFSVRMKMIKDEVIWLKATKLITLFKAKITPTSVRYYSSVKKNYFEGDFSMIKQFLGVEINFEQLQNLFLGQALLDLKKHKQTIEIQKNEHVLSPKIQSNLFDIFFFVNPTNFKLNKQSVINTDKGLQLDILYPKYLQQDHTLFPEQTTILVHQRKTETSIQLNTRSVVFNTDVNTSFHIPSTYKRIQF